MTQFVLKDRNGNYVNYFSEELDSFFSEGFDSPIVAIVFTDVEATLAESYNELPIKDAIHYGDLTIHYL